MPGTLARARCTAPDVPHRTGAPTATPLSRSVTEDVDTDGRPGWCNLTFTVTGRIVLDVQFYPDGDAGQCPDALPAGQYRSAFVGTPVTVKIDADGRSGGCQLLLRLRHF